jgi:hypothetical protein
MKAKRMAGFVLACGALLAAGGCLGADPLMSGLAKIAAGRILSLQVSEVQAVTLWAEEKAGVEQVPLTNGQAEAVLQFLEDNQVNTIARAQYLAEHTDEIVVSDAVKNVVTSEDLELFLSQIGQTSN